MSDTVATPLSKKDEETLTSILPSINIFGAMSKEQVLEVSHLFFQREYAAGDTIFDQGSHPEHVYIVLSGVVDVNAKVSNSPNWHRIAHIELGQCFGQVSVLGIQPRLGRAVATKDCQLLIIPAASLNTLRKEHSDFFTLLLMNISREVCRRLSDATQLFLEASVTANSLQYAHD